MRPMDDLDAALSRLHQTPDAPESYETGWRAAVRREEAMQMPKNKPNHTLWRAVLSAAAALVLIAGGLAGMNFTPGSEALPEMAQRQMKDAAYEVVEDTESAVAYSMSSGSSVNARSAASADSAALTAESSRKLVRTVSITLKTAAFDQSMEAVQALLQDMGGYVEELYQYGDVQSGRSRSASLTLRVPTERVDEMLGSVTTAGRVTERSDSVTDMTLQYSDNAARLNTLREKMERLNQLMAQAETVGDLIQLESAIEETQYQLDSYETAQRTIDSQADMTRVTLWLEEETPAQSAAAEDISLMERIGAALRASLNWLVQFGRGLLVFVAMALPVAGIVVLIALIVRLICRRRKKER